MDETITLEEDEIFVELETDELDGNLVELTATEVEEIFVELRAVGVVWTVEEM